MVGRLVGRRAAGFVRYAVRCVRSSLPYVIVRTYVSYRLSSHLFCHLFPLYFSYTTPIVESNESKPRQCRRKNPEIVPLEARDDDGFRRSIVACLPPSAFCAFCSCALPEPALDAPPTDSYSYNPSSPYYIYYFQNDAPFRPLRSHRFGFRLCPSPAGW